MNAKESVKVVSGNPGFNNSRRAFLRYFPWRVSAVYLATNVSISAISVSTAAFLAGCTSIAVEQHGHQGYPNPWQRDYLTKIVSYDKIKTLEKRGSRIKRGYIVERAI